MAGCGSKFEVKRKVGRPKIKHGGYSFLVKGVLPSQRKYLASYLSAARSELCKDYGGENRMSASQVILLDRMISKLGCLRLMEEFARQQGVFSSGELLPCLRKSYLGYSNSLRRDLESIKELGADQLDQSPTLQEIIKEFDAQKESEKDQESTSPSGDGHE